MRKRKKTKRDILDLYLGGLADAGEGGCGPVRKSGQ
eukprot:gene6710-16520_t